MRTKLTAAGFLLVAAFFLVTEHRAHAFGLLPFLFVLACPLLHLFAHGGHGSAHGREDPRGGEHGSLGSHDGHGAGQGTRP